jgi:hypothetical protein
MSLNNSLMPTPRWVSKGPRSYQLLGPFALPGLRHRVWLLTEEGCFEGTRDRHLARRIASASDGLVDCSAQFPRKPNIGFSVTPFATCLTETLSPLAARFISHGFHPYCS